MRRAALPLIAVTAAVLSGCGGQQNSAVSEGKPSWQSTAASHGAAGHGSTPQDSAALATGEITNPEGKKVGTVELAKADQGMTVRVTTDGLPPGFHGMHLHAVGKCEADSHDPKDPQKKGHHLSSGGHLAAAGQSHPDHDGDLPVLYVGKDGRGKISTLTDRIKESHLDAAAGLSMIIHNNPDNYANIPTRYAPNGPDAETKAAGDSGPRIGCAVLKKKDAGGGH
ncbi:superoxide dismutase, Cu-Zn family [Austwickia chelonae]|uniref:Superoxide dismutase n=1 Tax=Austwickia chelonae NBRC 105200 TaxID=1184607 RepID=K6UNR2_9MICO|nr:superoxide dismutase family protein [Austwickia chelonae]GAB79186.1 superoxide dismutase [Austwickia chelonae NBRC 105200]SEW37049.1 superoxide dismutase, Cu-Zn family [Austwickia chelonae]